LQSQLRDWARGILKILTSRHGSAEWYFKRGAAAFFIQEYEGRLGHDVSIIPWNGELSALSAATHLMDSPSTSDVLRMSQVAQRNTWPKIPRIISHCTIEFKLERCVQRLRQRLANEAAEQRIKQKRAASGCTEPSSILQGSDERPDDVYVQRALLPLSGLSVTDRKSLSGTALNYLDDTTGGHPVGKVQAQDEGRVTKGIIKSTSMSKFYYSKS